jgi:hypothetical protein
MKSKQLEHGLGPEARFIGRKELSLGVQFKSLSQRREVAGKDGYLLCCKVFDMVRYRITLSRQPDDISLYQ